MTSRKKHRKTPEHDEIEAPVKIKHSEAVRRALRALERSGRLTPGDVVEAGRDPESPLHPMFEWDDGKAAERWRLEQARSLIRSVTIRVEISEDRVITAPVYIRDGDIPLGDQGYRTLPSIKDDPDACRSALYVELLRVEGLLSRAEALAEALGYLEVVAKVRRRVEKLRRVVQPVAGA